MASAGAASLLRSRPRPRPRSRPPAHTRPPAPVTGDDARSADRRRWPTAIVAAAAVVNLLVVTNLRVPFVGPLAGFGLLVGLPTWLLYLKVEWTSSEALHRFAYSLVATLLLLFLTGLAINTVLPVVGVARPLDRIPILLTVDVVCLALARWRRERWRPPTMPEFLRAATGADKVVLAVCALTVPMAAIGAVRLNNGAGGSVTFAMLVVAAAGLVLLLRWRHTLHPGTVAAAFYLVGLALLLMTSLRGWSTSGHDIQREFRVFELTRTHGNWHMARLQDAYNACLSLTVLPTMISALTKVADAYVYKVFFQILFAFCPVLVYRIARRYTSTGLSMVAVIWFVAFPTYFTDMPFLNRQEVAFLFFAAAVLVAGDRSVPRARRQWIFAACSIGVVLSHYSTAYLLLGTIAVAWLCRALLRAVPPRRRLVPSWLRRARAALAPTGRGAVVGFVNVAVVVAAIALWNGAATHTTGGLGTTLSSAVQTLRGATAPDSKSGDTSYNLFALHKPSPQERLADYRAKTLAETDAGRLEGYFYSRSVLSRYPTPLVATAELPKTAAGRLLGHVGVDVSSVNAAVRQGSAKLLQLFVGLGLLSAVFARRRRYVRAGGELCLLGFGAFVILLVQTVVPVLSVQYGVLRAFLQGLVVLAPFVAAGSVLVFGRLGRRWAFRLASVIAVGFFLSLTGVVPQALGGYPPQLHLNNAGDYYDLYYVHPQELSAIVWLQHNAADELGDVQSDVVSDRYSFTPPTSFVSTSPANDIFPTLLRDRSYVFLGYDAVRKDLGTIDYAGDLLTYRYPTALLDDTRNLLYSSDGTRIYR